MMPQKPATVAPTITEKRITIGRNKSHQSDRYPGKDRERCAKQKKGERQSEGQRQAEDHLVENRTIEVSP